MTSKLETYRRKRDFKRTPEPAGKTAKRAKAGWSFVIQKHAARRLHYDFRLECEGVLKSWAVPQGPCLDPSQKRLAVKVEDHPLEYGGFEGGIPAGEYGGGTVLLWDQGTWSTDGDPIDGLKRGKLKFRLEGNKLKGGWTLVRMRLRPGERGENWLLIKERDDEARPLSDVNILEDRPESVASGMTINEIAASPERMWSSNRNIKNPEQKKTAKRARSNGAATSAKAKAVPGARRAKMPREVEPQLATLADKPPLGQEWLHEIKFDGYRILACLDKGKTRLLTRKQNDWTGRFPEIAAAISQLAAKQGVLDGEVVALLPDGVSKFQALQTALSEKRTSALIYYAFDLLYLDGFDLRVLPLEERKKQLAKLLSANPIQRLRFSDHFEGDGDDLVAKSCRLGLEGIVSKRRTARYTAGRGTDWLKIKCHQRQEFVVGGFTESTASRRGIGALLLGYFDAAGELVYAGKVGSGFSERSEQDVRERLKAREQKQKPFSTPVLDEHKRTTHWVRPDLVAEVEFGNWTDDGHLRHPVFQGLREDKPAQEVVLERRAKTAASARRRPSSRDTSRDDKPSPAAARRVSISAVQSKELSGIKLTHPDRILYPDVGLTKRDLVQYYASVSELMLPHIVNRPLSLVRCPDGQGGPSFYQKHAAAGTPSSLERVMIREKNTEQPYLAIQGLAGLLSVVQMGVLEIHPWGSTLDDLEKPDRLIFDLDPDPSVPWPRVIAAAKEVRQLLQDLGLESFPKVSGRKGLHLVVPIQPRHEWPEVKKFCRAVATKLAADAPSRYTANMSKAQRHGRIYVDYLRNERGATAIAPYSTRNRPGAPVAVPLTWKELSGLERADQFNVGNMLARIASLKSDPWLGISSVRQSLSTAVWKSLGKSPK